jgi:hypothetical protein
MRRLVAHPLVVVGVDPGVDRGLRGGHVGEGAEVVQQLALQGLVEALDLAGGGRLSG